MVGPHQHRPAQVGALRKAVHPRHRVLMPLVGLGHGLKRGVDVGQPDVVGHDVRALDWLQPYARRQDEPRQTDAAHGRPEDVGVLVTRARQDLAVRRHQLEILDELAECAVSMMVLAVDVIGDRAADRDELGPWKHRREEAPRQEHIEDLRQTDPRFALKYPRRAVEGHHAIEPRVVDHRAAAIDGRVAIAAAQPARDAVGIGGGLHDPGESPAHFGAVDAAFLDWKPPPARERDGGAALCNHVSHWTHLNPCNP